MEKVFLSVLMILTVLAVQACDEDGVSGTGTDSFLGIQQTGQIASFAEGDDGDLQAGVAPPSQRFTDNENGTIRDNLTGFLWTKDAGCLEPKTWEETLETASTIGNGDCGLTDGSVPGDWFVPNVRQLNTLLDYGNNSPALPAGHPFIGIEPTTALWSSTNFNSDSTQAYTIDFADGVVGTQIKNSTPGRFLLLQFQ